MSVHLPPAAWPWREPAYPRTATRMVVDGAVGGADLYGGVTEVARGATIPLHWHRRGELQFVLAGRGVLLHPDGRESAIGPRSAIFSPRGRSGAHGFRNTGRAPLTILFLFSAPGGRRPAINLLRPGDAG